MKAKILDGKELSKKILCNLKTKFIQLQTKIQRKPKISIILVGNNLASETYVNIKSETCKSINVDYEILKFDENISQKDLIKVIIDLNHNNFIDGVVVQLPLPEHISSKLVISYLSPLKDIDGMHPENFGKMCIGSPTLTPATPAGILELIKFYSIPTEGKNCVVLGRSKIVGLPISIMMSLPNNPGNSTITLCHSKTKKMSFFTTNADILIVALGIPDFITADMVKKDVVIIDVGINRIQDNTKKKGYRLCGDVSFEEVSEKASYITPVPGGVGPMTIAALLTNLYKTFELDMING